MSIPVRLDALLSMLSDYGAGYLLTTGGGRVKAVTVDPVRAGSVAADGSIALPGSRGSAANLAETPDATLLFSPPQPRGYTLIVDGTASGDAEAIRFVPVSAVLHRPASHADGPPAPGTVAAADGTGVPETMPASDATAADEASGESGCGHDCRPVE